MSALEAVLRRDRSVVVAALAIITALAWADLVWLANDMWMGGMDMTGFRMIPAGQGWMMPIGAPWQPIEFAAVFAMWVAMMIGMMTPSVAPMILVYARIGRQAAAEDRPFASAWFALGYLLSWTGFSIAATIAQWALQRAALLTPMMENTSNVLGAGVLIIAGVYQWTPLKQACLSYCQSPLGFVLRYGFRRDPTGALALGFRHGLYCIGCCWAVMALLFVAGVMNLFWIAALAALVLVEKLAPFGRAFSRLAGIAFVAGGAWLLIVELTLCPSLALERLASPLMPALRQKRRRTLTRDTCDAIAIARTILRAEVRATSDPARCALASKCNGCAVRPCKGSEKAKQYQAPSLNSLLSGRPIDLTKSAEPARPEALRKQYLTRTVLNPRSAEVWRQTG